VLDETKIAYDGLKYLGDSIRSLKKQRGRILFRFGFPIDIAGPVTPTPEYAGPIRGELIAMNVLKIGKKIPFSLVVTDAAGNAAEVESAVFTVTDPAILAIELSEDGKSGFVLPVGPLGTANLNVVADADLGEGVKSIEATGELQVFAGDAAIVGISFGEPVDA
jgi:hypothetical protein